MNLRRNLNKHKQSGLSMIELMISVTLGCLLLAGMTTVFVNVSNTRQEVEKAGRQIENGRYGMQLLSDDLASSGFLAEFDPTPLDTTALAALPDACATDQATLQSALPLHVQGYDNGAGAPSCLTDVKTDTDIVVVRRASTCVAGATNCDAFVAGQPYFQASLCAPATGGTQLSSSPATNADYAAQFYALESTTAALVRNKTDCTAVADIRRYRTHIYFIANNSVGSDGIPTLKRAELGAGAFTIVPLVEGIDNLQLEYGIDADNNGTPDSYNADPGTVASWRNVMSVKLNLLARNTEKTTGYTDARTFTLGQKADGTDNTVGPFGDYYKRHGYTAVVRLANPAGRRE